jgi:molecular chaperone HscB
MIRCPSCAREQEPQLFCRECGAPLAVEVDCFAALGFPRRLTLDPRQLETAYHDRGRLLHPDRFATAPASVRDASLRSTALLTRSYRTLRDPVGRGRYWLELRGEKLSEDNKQVPLELAELVFEVHEELGELREAVDSDAKGAGVLVTAIRERRQALLDSIEESQNELRENFARWDAEMSAPDELTRELKVILSKIAYLRTLVRDV